MYLRWIQHRGAVYKWTGWDGGRYEHLTVLKILVHLTFLHCAFSPDWVRRERRATSILPPSIT